MSKICRLKAKTLSHSVPSTAFAFALHECSFHLNIFRPPFLVLWCCGVVNCLLFQGLECPLQLSLTYLHSADIPIHIYIHLMAF